MSAATPSRKDLGEFYRLGSLSGLIPISTIVEWAEGIVASDDRPHIAYIELCLAGSKSPAEVQTLLIDVPGQPSGDLAIRMLLGHAARLVASPDFLFEAVLLRLYRIANAEAFPRPLVNSLITLEDEYSLVRDGVIGTREELRQEFTDFLRPYESYAQIAGN